MKAKFLLTAVFVVAAMSLAAQTGTIKGRVVDRLNRNPIAGAVVTIGENDSSTEPVQASEKGEFIIEGLAPGTYRLTVSSVEFQPAELSVKVGSGVADVGSVILAPDVAANAEDNNEFSDFDDETSLADAQNMPSTLRANKDVFDQIAGYTFGAMRFRPRGYESGTADILLNGIYYNDAMTDYAPYSLWSGLNDVTRSQQTSSALGTLDYGLGGINSISNIDTRPSAIRAGTKVSATTNSAFYAMRLMATYSSGFNAKGWAWAASLSTRQGGNNWVKGVNYNSFGYYAGVEKRFGVADKHRLSLMIMGTPTLRGAQMAATQEAYDLLGNNYYNPNWGYQNGKLRNARVRNSHEPVISLNWSWKIDKNNDLRVAAGYRFGKNAYSALDWGNSYDPRPDYYRQFPSFFTPGSSNWFWAQEQWSPGNTDFSQVNWGNLYNVNYNNFFSADDVAAINNPNVTTKTLRSTYIIQDRHTDQKDLSASAQWKRTIDQFSELTVGGNARINKTAYFTTINDLLGGDYWYDINKYALRVNYDGSLSYVQTDLNNPNRVVKKGDTYGYSYTGNIQRADLWALYKVNYASIEAFAGLQGGAASLWRDGLFKAGASPDNSYGPSAKRSFWTYTAKAGVLGKISMAHQVSANIVAMEVAPDFVNAFAAPRTRNTGAPGLTTEKRFSVDLNYNLRLPWIRARVSGFYTSVRDQNKTISFYDDGAQQFVNFLMWGVDNTYIGTEIGVTVPVNKYLDAIGALSYGDYRYSSNPNIKVTYDMSGLDVDKAGDLIVRWKDFHVSGTPQTAACIGLKFHGRNMLFAELNGCYYDAQYIDMNPLRRVDATLEGLTPGDAEQMTHQEKFPAAFLINASVGKTWTIDRKYSLGANLSVNNILNSTNYKTGGYEQMRYRKSSTDNSINFNMFGPKYYYLFGATYMAMISLRF